MLGNAIRNFEIDNDNYVDEDDPWKGILTAAYFSIRFTFHTTNENFLGQLIFGRYMILPIMYVYNWKTIIQQKQALIIINNKQDNCTRLDHDNRFRD